ncbi:TetR family transcriptional regulator [Nonomuraea sp. NPDC050310]|uniref:TetR/AcrR family transcriptional regulator n=1 Tax=unclassified Nonomuraea TaxID=2593643 RepID=UPI0033DEF52A
MTTRREQTSQESRELILAAAAELFAEKGYRQTTFIDVAARSGISRGSIPWHFGSKEGLLLAVLERSMERVRATLAQAPPEAFEVGIEALLATPTTKLFVTLLVEALEPDSPIRERYAEIHAALREHCRRWLETRALPPEVPVDALAVAVIGAGIGIHQQWLLAPEQVDFGQALGALRFLVEGAAPAEQTRAGKTR